MSNTIDYSLIPEPLTCMTCGAALDEDNKAHEGDAYPMCIDCAIYYEEDEE